MGVRSHFWFAGVLVGLLLAWAIPTPGVLPSRAAAFLIGLLSIGLLGEWFSARPARPAAESTTLPADTRPPDGIVGLIPVEGVLSEPNEERPRLGAFRALEARSGSHPPPGPGIPRLLGRVAVFSLFIGRDGKPWSDAEIVRAHASIERACVWLEREAIRWQAPVNLDLADTYFVDLDPERRDVEVTFIPEGDTQAPFEAKAVTKALVDTSRTAARLGFRDAAEMFAQLDARVLADARVWLVHPRCAGRSMAISADLTELIGVSLALCYAREANFPEPLRRPPYTDPVTVVHELLHLFGASDKYAVPISAFHPGSVTSRDVMRLDSSRLERLRIDRATAAEIGWTTG